MDHFIDCMNEEQYALLSLSGIVLSPTVKVYCSYFFHVSPQICGIEMYIKVYHLMAIADTSMENEISVGSTDEESEGLTESDAEIELRERPPRPMPAEVMIPVVSMSKINRNLGDCQLWVVQ